ncbi:Dynein light chain 4, axonemal [Eumeta japonica]|uniref:Dynein axonemal light chain 4 n=1 Tax=Eumeta variegata TaxID=151549 RepID=A0A4C1XVE4_EUMVA|nr:Dynein light chain 4, axonemal [Eumeta japonica]
MTREYHYDGAHNSQGILIGRSIASRRLARPRPGRARRRGQKSIRCIPASRVVKATGKQRGGLAHGGRALPCACRSAYFAGFVFDLYEGDGASIGVSDVVERRMGDEAAAAPATAAGGADEKVIHTYPLVRRRSHLSATRNWAGVISVHVAVHRSIPIGPFNITRSGHVVEGVSDKHLASGFNGRGQSLRPIEDIKLTEKEKNRFRRSSRLIELMLPREIATAECREEMRMDAIEVTQTACEKYAQNNELAARMVKELMDKKYGPSFHVVVGESYGFEITHECTTILYMYFGGNQAICIWKCS